MKKQKRRCFGLFCALILTGCGKDEALSQYQADMETFFEHIQEFDDNMNAVDVNEPDYLYQMLTYLDALDEEIAWMAELEVPAQFSAVDSLADEASENMTQAVSYYHMAYEGEEYDENLEQAAKEYYDRANVRIQYIVTILHGEIPEGEGVVYTEEDAIFGGGYLNKPDEDDLESNDFEPDDFYMDDFEQEGLEMDDFESDDFEIDDSGQDDFDTGDFNMDNFNLDDFDTDDTVIF